MNLKNYIRSIPDYPKKGILFRDITTLIKDTKAFNYTTDKMVEMIKDLNFNRIVAIESRGFIFGSVVANKLSRSLILIRKKNKLPADTYSEDFELEYGKATIEIHKDSIQKNDNVIIIDDLIATGGTSKAAAKLVEKSGGKVECFIFVINLFDLGGKNLLEKESYKTLALIDFPGH
jgi:adenine phosphoribosyltransferase